MAKFHINNNMSPGQQVKLKIVDRLSEKKALVEEVSRGHTGLLIIKGELRINKSGIINAWVLEEPKGSSSADYLFGNSYFGKFSISQSISDNYCRIIKSLYRGEKVTDGDISILKGMFNRCIKKDQWDWFTTYKYLGYPNDQTLRGFVHDSVRQRNLLREGTYTELHKFFQKYQHYLSSILFHISEVDSSEDFDTSEAPLTITSCYWERLSEGSKKNIILAERIHGEASIFVLMHYFVTLEQEFVANFITPFLDKLDAEIVESPCSNERYLRTHDILRGAAHFSLGAASFIGGVTKSNKAPRASNVIEQFQIFISNREEEFREICTLIESTEISGMKIPTLRNSLAHGDMQAISSLSTQTMTELRSALFEEPCNILNRLLSASMISQKATGQSVNL